MMTNRRFLLVLGLVSAATLFATPQQALARDDFGRIVKHIERQYHVHRQHRFLLGVAGFTVKFWHVAGVKSFKAAIFENRSFENQPFRNAGLDTGFDEIVRAAADSGWQPMIQEYDRHSGERTYIYAQDDGRDIKLLAIVLESDEAVVFQVKVNPDKLAQFIEETSPGRRHRDPMRPRQDTKPEEVEVAATAPQWEGTCLYVPEEAERPVQR
jgi:hypothetical protein